MEFSPSGDGLKPSHARFIFLSTCYRVVRGSGVSRLPSLSAAEFHFAARSKPSKPLQFSLSLVPLGLHRIDFFLQAIEAVQNLVELGANLAWIRGMTSLLLPTGSNLGIDPSFDLGL
jgi:hypothetical protein